MKKLNLRLGFFALLFACFFSTGYGQGTISGSVLDEELNPLPGVNIIIKGAKVGTTTDFDGNFSFDTVEKFSTILVSYLGFEIKEVAITYGTPMKITLVEQSARLDEVIVTSRKSSENLQEVPISVSSFSVKSLESKGISSVDQIAGYIPNVEIDVNAPFSGTSSVLSPFIRGIGQADFAINFDPGVGLYVDGVYYARSLGSVIDLLDVQRIEVLKGPQGTLFGRNTIGGAINVVTKDPIGGFSATGEVTAGNYNRVDTKLSIQIPIIEDKLGASFSFSSRNRDGFVKRVPFRGEQASDLERPGNAEFFDVDLDSEQGNQNNDTWRAKLAWKPSDKYKAAVSFDYSRVRENQNGSSLLAVSQGAPGGPPSLIGLYNACTSGAPLPPGLCDNLNGAPGYSLLGRTPFDERFVTGDPYTSYGTGDVGTFIDLWGLTLNQTIQLSENTTLKSITGYRKMESAFGEDQDNSPLPIVHLTFRQPQKQFSQEFQLAGKSEKLKWLVGAYYFTEDGSITDNVNVAGGLAQFFGVTTSTVDNFAGFGQATYNFSKRFSATLGLRYTTEKKTIESSESDLNRLLLQLGAAPPEAFPDQNNLDRLFPEGVFEQTFNEPTLRLGLEYKASDDTFLYGSFAQGFKSGGWSTRVTGPVLEAPAFKPEKADTYEIGFKSEFANKSVRLNLAAFYTDFQDLQVTVQRGISPFLENAAKATIKGVEVDLLWQAGRNWLLSANAGWLDAAYTEITDPAAQIQTDFKFNNTPDFSASISSDYTIPLGDKIGRLLWHVDASTKSEVYNDAVNTPLLRQPGFTLLNSSLALQGPNYNWKITIGGTNLTDQTYLVSGFDIPAVGTTYGIYARPAEFNIGASFKF